MSFLSIQEEDFVHQDCYNLLAKNPKCGAIVTFTGLVRDFAENRALHAIKLEHYPKMTEKALDKLIKFTSKKFNVNEIVIIHRVGKLKSNEQIVFVGVSSQHRKEAFIAAQFIMDRLKNDVPIWKKEIDTFGDEHWIPVKESDLLAGRLWNE